MYVYVGNLIYTIYLCSIVFVKRYTCFTVDLQDILKARVSSVLIDCMK